MDEKAILVTVGCGRMPRIFDTAAKHGYVVLALMDGQGLSGLEDCRVYFYETG